MYKIYFTRKAEKELLHLSSIDRESVLEKIPLLSSSKAHLDIKKLVNVTSFYRLRIGKVRVIFEIFENKKQLWIRKVGYRGSVYRY